MNVEEVRSILEKNNFLIKKKFHVKEIGIFGSFVKEKQGKHSDLDVLVVFQRGHKYLFNFLHLLHYLEELLGIKVDLVMKDAIKPRLEDKILGEVQYV